MVYGFVGVSMLRCGEENTHGAGQVLFRALLAFALCVAFSLASGAIAYADDEKPNEATPVVDDEEADEEDDADDASVANASSDSSTADNVNEDGDSLPDYSKMTLKQLQAEVKKKTDERDEIVALLEKYAEQMAQVTAQLKEASAELDEGQKLAEHSVRERYKVQRQYPSLIEAVLCSQDWQSFIAGIEYIEAASKASVGEVSDMREEVAKLEREKTVLEEMTAATEKKKARVEEELEAVAKARDEAQRLSDLVTNAKLTPDGADWKGTEKEFIEEWAPRIDAYFEGTAMADTGEYFAKAAWDNYIDPRFSPAISNIESSKGAICIRPYNAWGWGAADPDPAGLASEWSSWEEAINAHVKGLAAGYGYTISKKGAKKYCPPNWQLWYATTVDQMNSI